LLLLTTIGVLAFSHGGVAAQAASVSSPDGSSPADAAAIRYVEAQYPGSGQARVLGTEADHKHGAAVYDVRILAPNGTVSVVHVQQRNNVVLSANQAESQRLHRSDN
jgi:hypothetical protein